MIKEIIFEGQIDSNPEIIKPDQNFLLSLKDEKLIKVLKRCVYCGSMFYPSNNRNNSCGFCNIKFRCAYCGKEHLKSVTSGLSGNSLLKRIKEINEGTLKYNVIFCNRTCSTLSRKRAGLCVKCNIWSEERGTNGLCSICASENGKIWAKNNMSNPCVKCGKKSNNMTSSGLCPDCNSKMSMNRVKKLMKPGICTKCNKPTNKNRDATGLCFKCRVILSKKIALKATNAGLCSTCGKYSLNRNFSKNCYSCCYKLLKKYKGNFFNREKFYSSKFDLIDFESENKKISWENLDPLNGVPGVWAVWSIDNKCLDVCQTKNIGVEMRGWIRNYYANKGKTDEELIEMNRRYQKYNRSKKRDIAKYCSDLNSKPIFKIVATNIDSKEEREVIETQYAYDNKAIFWNPAPGQLLEKEVVE